MAKLCALPRGGSQLASLPLWLGWAIKLLLYVHRNDYMAKIFFSCFLLCTYCTMSHVINLLDGTSFCIVFYCTLMLFNMWHISVIWGGQVHQVIGIWKMSREMVEKKHWTIRIKLVSGKTWKKNMKMTVWFIWMPFSSYCLLWIGGCD